MTVISERDTTFHFSDRVLFSNNKLGIKHTRKAAVISSFASSRTFLEVVKNIDI